jgi:hypothetical protein
MNWQKAAIFSAASEAGSILGICGTDKIRA